MTTTDPNYSHKVRTLIGITKKEISPLFIGLKMSYDDNRDTEYLESGCHILFKTALKEFRKKHPDNMEGLRLTQKEKRDYVSYFVNECKKEHVWE